MSGPRRRQVARSISTPTLPDVVAGLAGQRSTSTAESGRHDVLIASRSGRGRIVARPVLWGMALAGADGVARVLDDLREGLAEEPGCAASRYRERPPRSSSTPRAEHRPVRVTAVRAVLVTAPERATFWVPDGVRADGSPGRRRHRRRPGVGETIMGYFAGEVVAPIVDFYGGQSATGSTRQPEATFRELYQRSLWWARTGSDCPCRGSRWRSGTSPAGRRPTFTSSGGRPATRTPRAARVLAARRQSHRPSCTARSAFAGSRSGPASTAGRAATRPARRHTGPGTRRHRGPYRLSRPSSGPCAGARTDIELATDAAVGPPAVVARRR